MGLGVAVAATPPPFDVSHGCAHAATTPITARMIAAAIVMTHGPGRQGGVSMSGTAGGGEGGVSIFGGGADSVAGGVAVGMGVTGGASSIGGAGSATGTAGAKNLCRLADLAAIGKGRGSGSVGPLSSASVECASGSRSLGSRSSRSLTESNNAAARVCACVANNRFGAGFAMASDRASSRLPPFIASMNGPRLARGMTRNRRLASLETAKSDQSHVAATA